MSGQTYSFFIDETGTDQKSRILALACIVTRDPQSLSRKLEELKRSLLKDKRFKDIPSIPNLCKTGFHYCEDHLEVKNKFIDLISNLSFEAYICYERKSDSFSTNQGFAWYDRLFGKLLYDRLRKHNESIVEIYFEQHTNSIETRRQELEFIVKKLVEEIKAKDRSSFLRLPILQSAGKEEPCLAIADYTAAIFKDYEEMVFGGSEVAKESDPSSWQARNFSMLRPKVRVIHNNATGGFFTRKQPFP